MNFKLRNIHKPCDKCGQKEKSMWQHPRLPWKRVCNTCLKAIQAEMQTHFQQRPNPIDKSH